MLKLIQIEFFKLRRRRFIWLMLLSALAMPFLACLLFKFFKAPGASPAEFYRWSALSISTMLILPVVLGILCTLLMYNENQFDMLKQLWIVPVSKMGYFFSKFAVIFIYALLFMLLTFAGSVFFSVVPGIVPLEWRSVLYLLKKCLEIGLLMPFVMLPILALAAAQKGYLLPVALTLVYAFCGFMTMTVNIYVHPLGCLYVIMGRQQDVPGVIFTQAIDLPRAFLGLFIWDLAAIILAKWSLENRE